MKRYRIGRKQGSWINRTPPIRGGVFYKEVIDSPSSSDTEEECTEADEDKSDDVSQITSISSLSDLPCPEKEGLRHRGCGAGRDLEGARGCHERPVDQVVNAAVKKEVDEDMETYPSLDPLVQKEIARKYQVLHQRIADDGLYQCRYIEYGKEMVRYSTLFCLFGFFLYHQWYITSSVFLGLFWVSRLGCAPDMSLIIPQASNHVHRPRRWTFGHYAKLCDRHAHWHVHCRLLLWSVHWLVEEQSQRAPPGDQLSREYPYGFVNCVEQI